MQRIYSDPSTNHESSSKVVHCIGQCSASRRNTYCFCQSSYRQIIYSLTEAFSPPRSTIVARKNWGLQHREYSASCGSLFQAEELSGQGVYLLLVEVHREAYLGQRLPRIRLLSCRQSCILYSGIGHEAACLHICVSELYDPASTWHFQPQALNYRTERSGDSSSNLAPINNIPDPIGVCSSCDQKSFSKLVSTLLEVCPTRPNATHNSTTKKNTTAAQDDVLHQRRGSLPPSPSVCLLPCTPSFSLSS